MSRRTFLQLTAVSFSLAALCAVDADAVFATVPRFKENRLPFATVAVRDWVGEKIVFRHALGDQREGAYYPWMRADGKFPSYEELAGKTATITQLTTTETGDFIVTAALDESRETLYLTRVYQGTIRDVVFVRDLDAARHAYLGKTLWLMGGVMQRDGIVKHEFTTLPNLDPVHVTDIVPGDILEAPVRICFTTSDGRDGYWPVLVSRTNRYVDMSETMAFHSFFLTYNPRERYPFSPQIWDAIAEVDVVPGMTPLQVVMAYTEPDTIEKPGNPADGDWVYVYDWSDAKEIGTRHVFFKNGVVTRDVVDERKRTETA